ncbi:hypothetical protein ACLB2K_069083 [Fragaria x ananassa]
MSFRRQGSSGRIWEDRLQIIEQKNGQAQAIFSDKRNDEDLRNVDRRGQDRRDADLGSPSTPSTPNSKQEQKAPQSYTALDAVYRAGVVYHVGDSGGWSILSDYNKWSSTKEFHVGDTLIFTYDKMFHNLMQVDGKDYEACNTKSPIVFYDTGSDAINLKKPGDYYFIGGRNFEPEWYAMTLPSRAKTSRQDSAICFGTAAS